MANGESDVREEHGATHETAFADAPSTTVISGWYARVTWLAFGLVLPIVCFALDGYIELRVYGNATSAARVFVAVELGLLVIWEWRGVRNGFTASVFAAAFAVGSVFAVLTGISLLPKALFSVIILVGALGLVPFGTSLVYCVLAVRAFQRARGTSVSSKLTAFALGVVIASAPFACIRSYQHDLGERALANFVPNHYASYVRAREVMSILPCCDTSRLTEQPGPTQQELTAWCNNTWLDELRRFP